MYVFNCLLVWDFLTRQSKQHICWLHILDRSQHIKFHLVLLILQINYHTDVRQLSLHTVCLNFLRAGSGQETENLFGVALA